MRTRLAMSARKSKPRNGDRRRDPLSVKPVAGPVHFDARGAAAGAGWRTIADPRAAVPVYQPGRGAPSPPADFPPPACIANLQWRPWGAEQSLLGDFSPGVRTTGRKIMRWNGWLGMAALWAAGASVAAGAEWPTYRGDCQRSGYTAEELPERLSLNWQYVPRHRPQPAWSDRDTRMPFDRAPHPVISGGRLFFGSSADCKVYALDASSGEELWSFFCDGPVRFAPALAGDRQYVASDDGHLYCLSADRGRLLWRIRGGPGESRVIGNDRLISRWPARGGPVVADGVVYFGAGIWPSEGLPYALRRGERPDCLVQRLVGWNLDASAPPAPTPPARLRAGIPGGFGRSAARADRSRRARGLRPPQRPVPLLPPPAERQARRVGNHRRRALVSQQPVRVRPGVGGAMSFPARARWTAITSRQIVHWQSGELHGSRPQERSRPIAAGRRWPPSTLSRLWSVPCPHGGNALIVAGARPFPPAADPEVRDRPDRPGGQRAVRAATTRRGTLGLAATGGRLYVATAAGTILCLGEPVGSPPAIRPEVETPVFENPNTTIAARRSSSGRA